MKIVIKSLSDKSVERRDYGDIYTIEIDGKRVFQVYDGEHEDNNLRRNFNDVYGLQSILQKVYEAALDTHINGTPFSIEKITVDEL